MHDNKINPPTSWGDFYYPYVSHKVARLISFPLQYNFHVETIVLDKATALFRGLTKSLACTLSRHSLSH